MAEEGVPECMDVVDGMLTSHLPWAVEDARAAPGPSSLRRATAGEFRVVSCAAGAGRYRRRRREIALTTGSYVGLLMVTGGEEIVEQGGRQVAVTAGSMLAWDSERSAACCIPEQVSKLTLFVPRERFAQLVPRPELMTMRTFSPSQAIRLLRVLLDELLDSAPLDQETVPAAGGAALELLRAVCRQSLPSTGRWDDAVHLRAALDYIDRHLGDARLDPARVARASGVSLRRLYELFEAADRPVWAHIRQRRLARAHEELSRTPARGTIAGVARSVGFVNSAHFTRAFRAEFGVPPSALRRRGEEAPVPRRR
ncbi:helix-turn-helix domain-containing protein [Amycolatopsis sp. Poz14]|uniref:helix-turn-helix domain-containing protein n=1 Tax=Amycolatopsis sp. Poz14 TaxID=1447705 RepID=UPI001EE89D90|nr:helix-turn-helix domain-containing protein [Amycolatopsis sp. Poz14]MCG3753990.1 helix-turn-helix domain-containing protein [Amycolatopsis sp. Poz14]